VIGIGLPIQIYMWYFISIKFLSQKLSLFFFFGQEMTAQNPKALIYGKSKITGEESYF
jgi:hypothetical protein